MCTERYRPVTILGRGIAKRLYATKQVHLDACLSHITVIKSTQNKRHDKLLQLSRRQWPTNATNMTKSGEADRYRPLKVSLHWQISIDVDAKLTNRRWKWDDLWSKPDRDGLKLLQGPCCSTPDELLLVFIELESVGLHPAQHIIWTSCEWAARSFLSASSHHKLTCHQENDAETNKPHYIWSVHDEQNWSENRPWGTPYDTAVVGDCWNPRPTACVRLENIIESWNHKVQNHQNDMMTAKSFSVTHTWKLDDKVCGWQSINLSIRIF